MRIWLEKMRLEKMRIERIRLERIRKELHSRLFALRVLFVVNAERVLSLFLPFLQRSAQALWKILRHATRLLLHLSQATTRLLAHWLWHALRKATPYCRRHPRVTLASTLVLLSLLLQPIVEHLPIKMPSKMPSAYPRLSLLPSLEKKNNPQANASQPVALGEAQGMQYQEAEHVLPVRTDYRVIEHTIHSSLYETALENNLELPLFRRFVDVMSYDVDFQRDIWAGARFRLLLSQRLRLAEGGEWRALDKPILEVAELHTGRQLYRYHRSGWDENFYDEESKPAKRLLRRTPMSGLRLTSRFGMRRHPILNYTRMHKGVDFAAPRGTPVLAAGDGVVRKKRYGKGYGRYVELRHSDRLSTLYAHMQGFVRGLREGMRVKQGQVIGYVGTSGISTGPHLHYEIHRNGRAVNPRRVRLPKPQPMEESKRALFVKKRESDALWLARGGSVEAASAVATLRGLVCGVWNCAGERHVRR